MTERDTLAADELARENAYLREQQHAIGEVVRAVARLRGLQPVLDEIVAAATRLCRAEHGQLFLADGDVFRIVPHVGDSKESFEYSVATPHPVDRIRRRADGARARRSSGRNGDHRWSPPSIPSMSAAPVSVVLGRSSRIRPLRASLLTSMGPLGVQAGGDRRGGAMNSGIREEPRSAYDLYARGRSMLSGGHPHQAVMLLSRAKLLEPEKASIREALGRALYQCGAASRARREFAKAVQLNPSDDYAHFALAMACERTGQRSRARGHAKLAVVLRPDNLDYVRVLERLTA